MENRPARQLAVDTAAMDRIHEILDGQEWSSEHLEWIADVIVGTGRKIGPPRDRYTLENGSERDVNEDTDYFCPECSTDTLEIWHEEA